MITVASIVGARPQIVKAAALSRAISNVYSKDIKEYIIHSGQHYDHKLSEVFFEEMGIPRPDKNLGVGSATHAVQTAEMLQAFEQAFKEIKPDAVVVYGDTNSTIAAALAAAKIHIPVMHIEAGLRSFNKRMPEEINRITTDHCSTLLFTPTPSGVKNLRNEGFNMNATPPYSINNPGVFHCGDIMLDNTLYFAEIAEKKSDIMQKLHISKGNFILATIHRDYNTDSQERLEGILTALTTIASETTIVLPLHPRTQKCIKQISGTIKNNFLNHHNIHVIDPLGFFDMLNLEKNCTLIMTDSGGVQKEAYFFKKPVLILRSETEWTEIIDNECGVVTDSNPKKILEAYYKYTDSDGMVFPSVFGDGKAASFICETLINNLQNK